MNIFFRKNTVYRWVLTAAHCMEGGSITISAGIDENGRFRDYAKIPLENQFIHPKYDQNKLIKSHDLGMNSIRIVQKNLSLSRSFLFEKKKQSSHTIYQAERLFYCYSFT